MSHTLPLYHQLNFRSPYPRLKISESLYLTLAECWQRCQDQLLLYFALRMDMPVSEETSILDARIQKIGDWDEDFADCFNYKIECDTQLTCDTNLSTWLQSLLDGEDKLPAYLELFQPQKSRRDQTSVDRPVQGRSQTAVHRASVNTPSSPPRQRVELVPEGRSQVTIRPSESHIRIRGDAQGRSQTTVRPSRSYAEAQTEANAEAYTEADAEVYAEAYTEANVQAYTAARDCPTYQESPRTTIEPSRSHAESLTTPSPRTNEQRPIQSLRISRAHSAQPIMSPYQQLDTAGSSGDRDRRIARRPVEQVTPTKPVSWQPGRPRPPVPRVNV